MKRLSACLAASALAFTATMITARGLAAAEPGEKPSIAAPADKTPDRAELEKRFADGLSGATLDGYFTETPGDESKPRESKYVINKVSKIKDDLWLFDAQIKYGEHDVTVPIPLVVRWAGDTPVITLDKVGVPGFGTFSARVLIYDNTFAGMWSGERHRGELYGRVVKDTNPKR
jgi:hypothetical protein